MFKVKFEATSQGLLDLWVSAIYQLVLLVIPLYFLHLMNVMLAVPGHLVQRGDYATCALIWLVVGVLCAGVIVCFYQIWVLSPLVAHARRYEEKSERIALRRYNFDLSAQKSEAEKPL